MQEEEEEETETFVYRIIYSAVAAHLAMWPCKEKAVPTLPMLPGAAGTLSTHRRPSEEHKFKYYIHKKIKTILNVRIMQKLWAERRVELLKYSLKLVALQMRTQAEVKISEPNM